MIIVTLPQSDIPLVLTFNSLSTSDVALDTQPLFANCAL